MDAAENMKYDEVRCPGCNNVIKYYDIKDSAWFGCDTCHTFFRQEHNEEPTEIKTFDSLHKYERILHFGDEGYLHERKFIVTGYLHKYAQLDGLYWDEYMMYSPDEDRNFVLANTGDDWYFIWLADEQRYDIRLDYESEQPYIFMQHHPFRSFPREANYTFDILYAAGEFDTNVLDDEKKLQVEEYVALPNIIVSETKDNVTTWYKGVHFNTPDIRNAFSEEIGQRFPETFEDRFRKNWPSVRNIALVTIGLLIITQMLMGVNRSSKYLLNRTYEIIPDSTNWSEIPPINAGIITVRGPATLDFEIETNTYNDWMELMISLTDVKSGRNFELTKAIEYYSGYEGGESWSEGSNKADAVLASVPTGEYQVNIYPYMSSTKYSMIDLGIYQNRQQYSNIVLVMLFILIYPVFLLVRKYNRDNQY